MVQGVVRCFCPFLPPVKGHGDPSTAHFPPSGEGPAPPSPPSMKFEPCVQHVDVDIDPDHERLAGRTLLVGVATLRRSTLLSDNEAAKAQARTLSLHFRGSSIDYVRVNGWDASAEHCDPIAYLRERGHRNLSDFVCDYRSALALCEDGEVRVALPDSLCSEIAGRGAGPAGEASAVNGAATDGGGVPAEAARDGGEVAVVIALEVGFAVARSGGPLRFVKPHGEAEAQYVTVAPDWTSGGAAGGGGGSARCWFPCVDSPSSPVAFELRAGVPSARDSAWMVLGPGSLVSVAREGDRTYFGWRLASPVLPSAVAWVAGPLLGARVGYGRVRPYAGETAPAPEKLARDVHDASQDGDRGDGSDPEAAAAERAADRRERKRRRRHNRGGGGGAAGSSGRDAGDGDGDGRGADEGASGTEGAGRKRWRRRQVRWKRSASALDAWHRISVFATLPTAGTSLASRRTALEHSGRLTAAAVTAVHDLICRRGKPRAPFPHGENADGEIELRVAFIEDADEDVVCGAGLILLSTRLLHRRGAPELDDELTVVAGRGMARQFFGTLLPAAARNDAWALEGLAGMLGLHSLGWLRGRSALAAALHRGNDALTEAEAQAGPAGTAALSPPPAAVFQPQRVTTSAALRMRAPLVAHAMHARTNPMGKSSVPQLPSRLHGELASVVEAVLGERAQREEAIKTVRSRASALLSHAAAPQASRTAVPTVCGSLALSGPPRREGRMLGPAPCAEARQAPLAELHQQPEAGEDEGAAGHGPSTAGAVAAADGAAPGRKPLTVPPVQPLSTHSLVHEVWERAGVQGDVVSNFATLWLFGGGVPCFTVGYSHPYSKQSQRIDVTVRQDAAHGTRLFSVLLDLRLQEVHKKKHTTSRRIASMVETLGLETQGKRPRLKRSELTQVDPARWAMNPTSVRWLRVDRNFALLRRIVLHQRGILLREQILSDPDAAGRMDAAKALSLLPRPTERSHTRAVRLLYRVVRDASQPPCVREVAAEAMGAWDLERAPHEVKVASAGSDAWMGRRLLERALLTLLAEPGTRARARGATTKLGLRAEHELVPLDTRDEGRSAAVRGLVTGLSRVAAADGTTPTSVFSTLFKLLSDLEVEAVLPLNVAKQGGPLPDAAAQPAARAGLEADRGAGEEAGMEDVAEWDIVGELADSDVEWDAVAPAAGPRPHPRRDFDGAGGGAPQVGSRALRAAVARLARDRHASMKDALSAGSGLNEAPLLAHIVLALASLSTEDMVPRMVHSVQGGKARVVPGVHVVRLLPHIHRLLAYDLRARRSPGRALACACLQALGHLEAAGLLAPRTPFLSYAGPQHPLVVRKAALAAFARVHIECYPSLHHTEWATADDLGDGQPRSAAGAAVDFEVEEEDEEDEEGGQGSAAHAGRAAAASSAPRHGGEEGGDRRVAMLRQVLDLAEAEAGAGRLDAAACALESVVEALFEPGALVPGTDRPPASGAAGQAGPALHALPAHLRDAVYRGASASARGAAFVTGLYAPHLPTPGVLHQGVATQVAAVAAHLSTHLRDNIKRPFADSHSMAKWTAKQQQGATLEAIAHAGGMRVAQRASVGEPGSARSVVTELQRNAEGPRAAANAVWRILTGPGARSERVRLAAYALHATVWGAGQAAPLRAEAAPGPLDRAAYPASIRSVVRVRKGVGDV